MNRSENEKFGPVWLVCSVCLALHERRRNAAGDSRTSSDVLAGGSGARLPLKIGRTPAHTYIAFQAEVNTEFSYGFDEKVMKLDRDPRYTDQEKKLVRDIALEVTGGPARFAAALAPQLVGDLASFRIRDRASHRRFDAALLGEDFGHYQPQWWFLTNDGSAWSTVYDNFGFKNVPFKKALSCVIQTPLRDSPERLSPNERVDLAVLGRMVHAYCTLRPNEFGIGTRRTLVRDPLAADAPL
jgi:hypothetical protein